MHPKRAGAVLSGEGERDDDSGYQLERALGIAVRTHRDRIKLYDQMTEGAESNGRKQASERWARSRQETEKLIGAGGSDGDAAARGGVGRRFFVADRAR